MKSARSQIQIKAKLRMKGTKHSSAVTAERAAQTSAKTCGNEEQLAETQTKHRHTHTHAGESGDPTAKDSESGGDTTARGSGDIISYPVRVGVLARNPGAIEVGSIEASDRDGEDKGEEVQDREVQVARGQATEGHLG